MPKLSSKRQITLPRAYCRELDLEPGDDIEIYLHEGRMTLVKKAPGAAAGVVSHLQPGTLGEDASRDDAIEQRRHERGGGKGAAK